MASEFVNNNFDNQDFSSVNSDYQEDRGASESLGFNKSTVEILLDLCENSKISTAATCIISETIMDLLKLHLKFFVQKIKKFIQENMANENIDFVTDTILNLESPFVLACKKHCREKAFASYFKTRDCYVERVEKIVGCNYKTGKSDC